MSIDFNVDPYHDDFDQTKDFHRILFKPGYAVQARELTQAQTILQDQVTKFADNIFKQNSPVTGGQVTTNLNCYYIKLQTTYNGNTYDVTEWNNASIQNASGTVSATVIATVPAISGDYPTLIVSYNSGSQFKDGDIIVNATNPGNYVQAITSSATGASSVASIAEGVFYVLGNFVHVQPSTTVISKYSNTPNARIGLSINETIVDYVSDATLLDPAVGATNYQAPGADRYQISLTLDTRPLAFGDNDSSFIELVRVIDGDVQKLVDGSVYNVIDDYFAKRDYETNGNYVVNDFKLTPKVNSANANTYIMSIGKGLAYVNGYRVQNQATIDLLSNRARTTTTQNNDPVTTNFGSYFYVDTVAGANGYFFDTTTYQAIDLHCVDTANVNTATASAYSATKVSTGYIRGLVFDHTTNTTPGSSANNYVYKAYVSDLQNQMPTANATAGTANTITFPTYFSASNSSYVGVNISITTGTSAGDFRTITAYDGVSKKATVNQNWTVIPDTTSVFALNYDIKDIDSLVSVDGSRNILGKANIDPESRVGGVSTGATILENPSNPELIFQIGSPYVASLTNTSYTTEQEWRNVSFTSSGGAVVATLPYTGSYAGVVRHFGTPSSTLSSSLVQQNYTIVVTNAGTSSFYVGQNIPWTTTGRTVTLDASAATATFSATDAGGTFTATIIAKVYVENADNTGHILKTKTLITANTTAVAASNTQVNTYTFVDDTTGSSTGQIHIQNAGLVSPGSSQSLYLSDVKTLVKILDTTTHGAPTTANLALYTDVTSRYNFDNGQRDNYYDHATIKLKTGAAQPTGDLLVFVDYYQHSGGDGYFSITSYTNEDYRSIPSYISKAGVSYKLRDCIDFRPARKNAQTSFVFRYSNAATNYGTFLPVDLETFTGDYSYYLGRRDKLVLSKDRSFQIIEGTPSLNPIFPNEPDGSLVVATMVHDPYTAYIPTEAPTGAIPNLSVQKVKHKRYTMEDIAGLEDRINNVEYYTSLNVLEQNAQSLQISDAYGLNRFKNGILVDDFSSYATADTGNLDYNATINKRIRQLTASQNVKNFPLQSLATVYNMGRPSTTTGYSIDNDGLVNYFSLPYTTANAASQKFASRTVNINPFSVSVDKGILSLTPNMDNWVDTTVAPALLITDPNLQIFQGSNNLNVLVTGDWKTVPGTETTQTTTTYQDNYNSGYLFFNDWDPYYLGTSATTTTTKTATKVQNNVVGPYSSVASTYNINNGYITDISILPYIRAQEIIIRAKSLKAFSALFAKFDNTDINFFISQTNRIELTNVTGTFSEGDIVGYINSGAFVPTAVVVGIYNYPNTSNVRLYVTSEPTITSYTASGTIQNALFNSSGVYQSSTASGTLSSTRHLTGKIVNVDMANNKLQLSGLANSTTSLNTLTNYAANTIWITAGTGQGQYANIATYYSSNQVAVLSSAITVANNDTYSLGWITTNENGSFYGTFNVPPNTFHTGQRVLHIDNSLMNITNTATTYAEATFYSEGIQTRRQNLDFGASPSGAKDTFIQTNSNTSTTIVDNSNSGGGGGGGETDISNAWHAVEDIFSSFW